MAVPKRYGISAVESQGITVAYPVVWGTDGRLNGSTNGWHLADLLRELDVVEVCVFAGYKAMSNRDYRRLRHRRRAIR